MRIGVEAAVRQVTPRRIWMTKVKYYIRATMVEEARIILVLHPLPLKNIQMMVAATVLWCDYTTRSIINPSV